MDELLDKLCEVLDDELERQENVRALILAQRDSVCNRNTTEMAAQSAALQLLIRDAIHAEVRRHEVLRPLVSALNLEPEEQTLTGLIRVVPSPWNDRLAYYQSRLHSTMHETRIAVRDTSIRLRRSLRIVGQCLQVFQTGGPSQSRPYTERGAESVDGRRSAVFINQKG